MKLYIECKGRVLIDGEYEYFWETADTIEEYPILNEVDDGESPWTVKIDDYIFELLTTSEVLEFELAEDEGVLESFLAYASYTGNSCYSQFEDNFLGYYDSPEEFIESRFFDEEKISALLICYVDWSIVWRDFGEDYIKLGDTYFKR